MLVACPYVQDATAMHHVVTRVAMCVTMHMPHIAMRADIHNFIAMCVGMVLAMYVAIYVYITPALRSLFI